jgi:peptidoglycan/LPS O-acetylase OafA/YrhL
MCVYNFGALSTTTRAAESIRIPTLDGWRGIAVLLVLVFHFEEFYGNRYFFNLRFFGFGQHGIAIFFVLSGFLITTKLRSQEKIDFAGFYLRRFFRLMPAAWVYLLALLGFVYLMHGRWGNGRDVLACFLFFRNLMVSPPVGNHTTHFWSLSLEEQFYFLWPLLLAAFGRRFNVILLSISTCLITLYEIMHANIYYAPGFDKHFNRSIQVDHIMVGCLLAFLLESEKVRSWFRRHGSLIFWICFPILMVDIWNFQNMPPLHEVVVIALMLGATSLKPTMLPSRILELPHLKTTGMLCYGIYLWQGLFFDDVFGRLSVVLLPTVVLASWLLIEQPFMALGKRVLERLNDRQRIGIVAGSPSDLGLIEP